MKTTCFPFSPLGKRIVVRLDTLADKVVGGIIIPEGAQEKPYQGVVVAVSKSWTDAPVKVADRVMIYKHGGTEVNAGGVLHVVVDEKHILAVLT